MNYDTVFDMIGRTPHVRLRMPGIEPDSVYLKLEGCNPTGSIKDRACAFMIQSAIRSGELQPGMIALDASSGNFACALALYSRMLGYEATVVVGSKLTQAKREFLEFAGATVYQVGDFTIQGNEFCRELVQREPEKYFFLDQLHNWLNPQAHYETTGPEILTEFPDVGMIVGSLGSGGTMLGVAEYVKQKSPSVRIIVVETASGSRMPGAGTFVDGDYVTPFITKGYNSGLFDDVVRVSEAEAHAAGRLLISQGVFCGLQTGAVVHAANASASGIGPGKPVVVISGDSGWKNLDKLLTLRRTASGCSNA